MTRKCKTVLPLIAWLAVVLGLFQPAAFGGDAGTAQQPSRKWVVYLLPHSHVDIGYTHLQPDVERKQWQNLETAMELCRKTADYPPGARFKWNTEVLWAVDSYLRQAPPEKQQQLIDAIRAGQIELDALYGNELTGLCRPEELLRLTQWAVAIGQRCGVKVESAMISDVPGYTWGIVSAFAQAGVKYFSIGPNSTSRIGRTMTTWEDKPFWWLAPDGKQKILCWIPFKGYGFGPDPTYWLNQQLAGHLAKLEQKGYPYGITYLRWTIGGDNGAPDATLPDVVQAWNAAHSDSRLIIATVSELFREFEKQYADKIPVVSGDFTPYWEDGAASSARETALNRMAAERLVQAETLSAMLAPEKYPVGQFLEAWRNVLLYDEHTWGAHNSISQPDAQFVKDQWKIKQAFALDADTQSRKLLDTVVAGCGPIAAEAADVAPAAVDVFNTSAWPRTELVVLSREMSSAGDCVVDPDGQPVASQRLSTRELAFLAKDVPGLAGKRYTVKAGKAAMAGSATAEGTAVGNSAVSVQLEPTSGAITSLRSAGLDEELCDVSSGVGLNRYYYVLRDRVREAQQAGKAQITVKESGPLVASLRVESDAPGCTRFCREIRVVDGLTRVDVIDVLDKKAVREKEGVHFGFAFNVPDGVMRMDTPWAVVRPEIDQMPGACKNWFTVGRWVDVSNEEYGVTWATLDAPLVEVGGITADKVGMAGKIGDVTDPNLWLSRIEPSQTLYSWVMNNHWFTNYRAEQEGPTTFRYALAPHKNYDPMAVQRFGIECSQPLVVAPARGAAPSQESLLELDAKDVLVASIKPSEDRKALIVRLFGASDKDAKATLKWGRIVPKAVWISNLAEERAVSVKGPVEVPAYGLVTLRADFAE